MRRHRPCPRADRSKRHDAHAASPKPRPTVEPFVELQKVTHTYGRGDKRVHALDATDLRIEKGDFIALVGPSGCGKSTILKLVTGLISASSGYVLVAGREVGAEPVRVGMAFQNPTLLPWLDVARQRDAAAQDRRAVPAGVSASSARPSSATASMHCWRKSGSPASPTNIPGSCRAA